MKTNEKFFGSLLMLILAGMPRAAADNEGLNAQAISSVTSELDAWSDDEDQDAKRGYVQAPAEKPKELIDTDQLDPNESEEEESAEAAPQSY